MWLNIVLWHLSTALLKKSKELGVGHADKKSSKLDPKELVSALAKKKELQCRWKVQKSGGKLYMVSLLKKNIVLLILPKYGVGGKSPPTPLFLTGPEFWNIIVIC